MNSKLDSELENACVPFLDVTLFSSAEHHTFAVRMLSWRRELGLLKSGSVFTWCATIKALRSQYRDCKFRTVGTKDETSPFEETIVNKDMCRLYIDGVPDEYFQTPERQKKLKNVLVSWCTHNAPYYRQGMHEVCALILLALDMEAEALADSTIPDTDATDKERFSSHSTSGESDMLAALWKETLLDSVVQAPVTYEAETGLLEQLSESSDKLSIHDRNESATREELNISSHASCSSGGNEGDLYWIFDKVMCRGLREIYRPDPATEKEHNELTSAAASANGGTGNTHTNKVMSGSSSGYSQSTYASWEYMTHIQDVLLRAIHPILWEHLQLCMIQPQLYSVSWTRLLFGRMFPPPLIFDLWDYIFDNDMHGDAPPPAVMKQLTDYPILLKVASFIVSLLIHLRSQLLRSDEMQAMTSLMRYSIRVGTRGGDSTLATVISIARSIESYIFALSTDPPTPMSPPRELMMTFRGDFSCLTPPDTIVMSGYLAKRGKVVHTWKRRWIVLTKKTLSYYTDETMRELRGQIVLVPEASVVDEDGRVHRLKFMISQPGHRPRVFQASNEESRTCWVRTIAQVLEHLQDGAYMGEDSVWVDLGEGEERDDDESITSSQERPSEGHDRMGSHENIAGVWKRVSKKESGLTGGDNKIPLDGRNNIIIRSVSASNVGVINRSSRSDNVSNQSGEAIRRHSISASTPTPQIVSYRVGLLAAGWLRKKGHINVNWKVRWCELNLNSDEEASFSYYSNRCPGDAGWGSTIQSGKGATEGSSVVSTTGPVDMLTRPFSMRRDESKPLGCIRITKNTTILNRSSGVGSYKFALFNANPGFEESHRRGRAHSVGIAGPNDSPEEKDSSRPRERLGMMGRVKSEVLFLAAVSESEKAEWMHLLKGVILYLASKSAANLASAGL